MKRKYMLSGFEITSHGDDKIWSHYLNNFKFIATTSGPIITSDMLKLEIVGDRLVSPIFKKLWNLIIQDHGLVRAMEAFNAEREHYIAKHNELKELGLNDLDEWFNEQPEEEQFTLLMMGWKI